MMEFDALAIMIIEIILSLTIFLSVISVFFPSLLSQFISMSRFYWLLAVFIQLLVLGLIIQVSEKADLSLVWLINCVQWLVKIHWWIEKNGCLFLTFQERTMQSWITVHVNRSPHNIPSGGSPHSITRPWILSQNPFMLTT